VTDANLLNLARGIAAPPGISALDIERSTDVRAIVALLYFLPRLIQAKTTVEIGVCDGSTTLPLLKAASEIDGTVYSIDIMPCRDADDFVRRNGLNGWWKFRQMSSDDFFVSAEADLAIDLAFIDGDHRYGFVRRDFENVWSRLTVGGIIVFHDWDPISFEPDSEISGYFPDWTVAVDSQGRRAEDSDFHGPARAIFDVIEEIGRERVEFLSIDPVRGSVADLLRHRASNPLHYGCGALILRKRRDAEVEMERHYLGKA